MDAKLTELQAANAAAREIRVYAVDMLRAQGAKFTQEDRAVLTRQADALRAILETDDTQAIRVNVYDVYAQAVKIGELVFTL